MNKTPANDTQPSQKRVKQMCDLMVERATTMMANEAGAPVEMIVDRLLTFAIAQMASTYGRQEALNMLRFASDQVKAGKFDHLIHSGRPN
ncbi:hypothetical protein PSC71_09160 [Devosia sp. J2-20]|uniref:hypothetical protein n=1 Tax=Devosia sp. J2-20 TaxID=3026161 RepID=UPI00249B1E9B|nr:hypothetical protein [Devosia sp. J2-20]WDR00883.1 hypothetical protein PSC71_09160 [Devosia sp. J2-20]